MTARPLLWAAGLAGSVVLHAGLLGMLWLAIRPDPLLDQPMPETEIEIQAYQLDRTRAQPQAAQGEPADPARATGAQLAAGAISHVRADAATAPSETLAGSAPPSQHLTPESARPTAAKSLARVAPPMPAVAVPAQRAGAVRPEPASLIAAAYSPSTAVASASPVAVAVATARPAAVAVATAASTPELLAVAAPPTEPAPAAAAVAQPAPDAAIDTTVLASAFPPVDPAAAVWLEQVPLVDTVPAATPAASAPAAGQRVKAALAFTGAGDGDIDPVSLAAFQSFMRPGDIAATGDPLRDGVAGLLAQVPCSRLQVGFDPDTVTLQVNGHIPEDDLRAPVLAALKAQMGEDIAISDNILILPRPQCGALSGIAGVGLPQSTDQITNPLLIGREAQAKVFRFADGELLSLDMTAPDYAAYIYLDYFDAGGDVLHLEPNEFAPLRQADAKAIQRIGARTMQEAGLKLVIGPPYGQEIAVAFAASEPLYDGLRPLSEPAAAYLDWLKRQVAAARDQTPGFKGEWVYFFVTTSGR